jgi:predicted nucleic acid-binding protein
VTDPRRFGLDSNILVYAIDATAGERQRRAAEIVRLAAATNRCRLALQNLGEFYHVATRKGHLAPAAAAVRALGLMRAFRHRLVEPTAAAVELALNAAAAGQLSYWDAHLLATLGQVGVSVLLSEDMQDGAVFAGVTVRNPLAGTGLPADLAALLGAGP